MSPDDTMNIMKPRQIIFDQQICFMVQMFQIIEQTTDEDRMRDHQAILIMQRNQLMDNLVNITNIDMIRVDRCLAEYEKSVSLATSAGIDVVTQTYQHNWDYLQSVFFATTILTTIGRQNMKSLFLI